MSQEQVNSPNSPLEASNSARKMYQHDGYNLDDVRANAKHHYINMTATHTLLWPDFFFFLFPKSFSSIEVNSQ